MSQREWTILVIGLLLGIPFSIFANLLTPYVLWPFMKFFGWRSRRTTKFLEQRDKKEQAYSNNLTIFALDVAYDFATIIFYFGCIFTLAPIVALLFWLRVSTEWEWLTYAMSPFLGIMSSSAGFALRASKEMYERILRVRRYVHQRQLEEKQRSVEEGVHTPSTSAETTAVAK